MPRTLWKIQDLRFTLIEVEKFRLYFSNAKGDRLGSETVKVRYNSNTSREKVIVEKY